MTAFATLDAVEALCVSTLSPAQEDRATVLLDQTANKIRAYTRQTFDKTTTTDTLRALGSVVRLPQRPVVSVTAVQLVDYLGNTFNLPVFGFDGVDRLDLAYYGAILNLPEEVLLDRQWSGTVKVTYIHGYETVPAEIVDLNAELVARMFNSPSQGVVGMRAEAVGPYSASYDPGSGVITLTQDDKDILNRYRRTLHTMELRG